MHPKAISEPQSIMFPIVSTYQKKKDVPNCFLWVFVKIFMLWMVVHGLTCTYCYRNMSPAGGSTTHSSGRYYPAWKYVMKIDKMGLWGGNCRFYCNYVSLAKNTGSGNLRKLQNDTSDIQENFFLLN